MGRMKWLVGLALLIIYPVMAQQGTSAVYWYAYVGETGDLELVDPQHPEMPRQTIDLPDAVRVCGAPSPDGRWLMVCYGDPMGQFTHLTGLMVMDMLTGAIHPVYDIPSGFEFLSDYDPPQWSPDSRSLAFNAFDKVYLYRLDDFSLHVLAETKPISGQSGGKYLPYFRLWSPDSQAILVEYDNWYRSDPRTLDVIRAADSQTLFSVYLSDGVGNGVGQQLCGFLWSPRGRYISFQPYCEYTTIFLFDEVFIWDIQQDHVEQLTDYTNPKPWTQNFPQRYAIFYPFWYDDQTLLVGVSGATLTGSEQGLIQPNFFIRTEGYHLPDKTPVMLSSARTEAWAINPISGKIAFLSEDMALGEDVRPEISNPQVSIGQFDGQELTASVTLTGGCDPLAWSPDGMYLSYTAPSVELPLNCQGTDSRTKIFFSSAEGVVTSHILSRQTFPWDMIGWVVAPRINAIMPYFPAGTPTPMPTFGGAG